jgi:hypothetical protein
MEKADFTLRIAPKPPGTVAVQTVKDTLHNRGFQEMESILQGLHFVLNKTDYVIQASIESEETIMQTVSIYLDLSRLSADAISSAAEELSMIVHSLAWDGNISTLAIYDGDSIELEPGSDRNSLCDLCEQIESRLLQSKRAQSNFPSVSAEEALKWMEDFPRRKERFVAAVREGKN